MAIIFIRKYKKYTLIITPPENNKKHDNIESRSNQHMSADLLVRDRHHLQGHLLRSLNASLDRLEVQEDHPSRSLRHLQIR